MLRVARMRMQFRSLLVFEAIEDFDKFLNCMNPTSGHSGNASEACHPSLIGGELEKEEVQVTQVDQSLTREKVDTTKKPPASFLTKDNVNQHNGVLNANKWLEHGQKRWTKQVCGLQRKLNKNLQELQRVIQCFQEPQLDTTHDQGW
jgi:hypothetical protein